MRRSLRSRLIVGMVLGLAVLLAAAGTAIYTVQHRQLYHAFDETLLSSANALALLFHAGPFGTWFDSDGLNGLPAGRIRQGALFEVWSDQRIDQPPPSQDADSDFDWPASMGPGPGPPPGFFFEDPGRPPDEPPDDRPPREPRPPGSGGPPGPPPPELGELWRRRAPDDTPAGPFIVRSPALSGADLPRLDPPGNQPRFERITMPDGAPGRAVGLRFEPANRGPGPRWEPPASLTLVVAASTRETEQQLHFLAALLAVTAFGTMAISGGVAWLVVSRGLRPLAAVARKIAAMDETGLKQRIADQGVPREIEPVVNQLNGLLARLDGAFDRERALTADVAHELRTPVAEIRAIAEITLGRVRAPDEYQQAFGETLETVKTLQGLIEKLLVLARLESGQVQPDVRPIALRPALRQHWTQMQGQCPPRGITLEDRSDPQIVVSADPSLLDIVLSNVLSNAVAYAPDGSSITAATNRAAAGCQLSVANAGCELSADDAAHVFDRFWRADAARTKTGLNCGLGLTLVRRAMEAMGGQAEAHVRPDRQFVLMLTFRTPG